MISKNGGRSSISSTPSLTSLVVSKEHLLKVWVKLDPSKMELDVTNQPTAIVYEKTDTVDDLKDRIFAKFRNTRWAMENDSFGIGIGCLCECGLEDNILNLQQEQNEVSKSDPMKDQLLHPVPNSAARNVQVEFSRAPSTSWHTPKTCSPRVSNLGSPLPLHANKLHSCTPGSTPLAQLRLGSKDPHAAEPCSLSPVKRGESTMLSRSLNAASVIAPKPNDLPRAQLHQSLLEPDELLINVCKILFGGIATQKAADALIIFSNAEDAYIFDDENIQNDDDGPLIEDMADYKLIVDEEQLRKLSLSNDEESTDHKQAILLLPRGFEGDVNLPSPNVISPSTTMSTHGPSGFTSPTITNAPLVEEGIGLVPCRDPMVQREGSPFLQSAMEAVTTESITRDKVFPKINVLVVEDNMINQAILSSFLRKHKISYKAAKNGLEAVEKWKEGGIHLILMDLGLPILSGIDAAKEIRKLEKVNGIGTTVRSNTGSQNELGLEPRRSFSSKAPVIIVALTASNSQSDKTEALLAGCNDYLTKPVNLDWLTRKITEWGCMQALIDFNDWKEANDRITSGPDRDLSHKVDKSSFSEAKKGNAKQEVSHLSNLINGKHR
ncbi:LANO_0E14994g1_1 [Lachancea nothofagi CBS 11611]|uniref:LANO_0E14994g1_1 n=1 Tax=Lachancea nothofagi CBS 11611 TaxID=1266666 RepID=A0A1G4K0P2_9SACH|nr:LANO_0E14994g1_1 [Lachancea nothofagi CBS 11611]